MRLQLQDIKRFYHVWFALLHFINEELHIVPAFPEALSDIPVSPQDTVQLRDALWMHDDLRERFIADNPAQLSAEDLAVVESWQYRIADTFTIVRSLQKHTIFLSHAAPSHVYGVLGLVSTIEETLPLPLPMYAKTVLLPFEHHIIYDSLIVPYNIMLGPGIRSGIQDQYRTLQEREGIITSLLPEDLARSARNQRQEISARNRKVFTAFRRELRKGGLSEHMVDVHATTIEAFAQETLLDADPPRGILDLSVADLQFYLERHPGKQPLTSFKRFIRFLLNTERINDELGEDMRLLLNQMRSEE
jgi:hypothetical protein